MKAVVLLSGGLDSATALAIAKDQGYACHALSCRYGQRHRVELEAAAAVAQSLGAVEHREVAVDLAGFGGSALTDAGIKVPEAPTTGIPVTYVPARNTVLLALALAWAETLAAEHIFVGVNAVDYSGYPDCRPEFIVAFEAMANLATKAGVEGRRLQIPRAVDRSRQGRDHPLRRQPRGGLRLNGLVLPTHRPRRCLRSMRELPAAPRRIRGGRRP